MQFKAVASSCLNVLHFCKAINQSVWIIAQMLLNFSTIICRCQYSSDSPVHPLCSYRKSDIHGLTVPTEGQLENEKHIYTVCRHYFSLSMKNNIQKWRISQVTNTHGPAIKAHAWLLMTTINDVVARWDTSQLLLCSAAEQSPRHTLHTRRQAPNHATNGVDVVLTPGAPRWVGVTVSHTSAAVTAAVGVSVEGELWLAICLRPRIPIRVQESWTRCRVHTQNPSSMEIMQRPWLNLKRCLIREIFILNKILHK